MNDGFTEGQRASIQAAFAEFPEVERVVLFGSRAIGNWTVGPDADLALFGDRLRLRDELRIGARLEDLALPFRVDQVRHASADDARRDHVARRGLEFYRRGDLPS